MAQSAPASMESDQGTRLAVQPLTAHELPQQPPSETASSSQSEEERFAEIRDFIGSQPGRVGVAVRNLSGSVVFEAAGEEGHALASVAKVYILVAYLDQVSNEGRDLTYEERALMQQMIEYSDNNAATTLWNRIGGDEGLQGYLRSEGLPEIEPAWDGSWGSMRVSALGLSTLLARLYEETLLEEPFTEVALEYMANVIDAHSWGVGTDPVSSYRDLAEVYQKNGWYPEADGWIVNSVGIVVDEQREYVLVILTDAQPSLHLGKYFLSAAVVMLRESLSGYEP